MKTQNPTNRNFLAITVVLATGVLTGCQYCEPLLMASLVIGAVYKGLSWLPLAGAKHTNQNT